MQRKWDRQGPGPENTQTASLVDPLNDDDEKGVFKDEKNTVRRPFSTKKSQ